MLEDQGSSSPEQGRTRRDRSAFFGYVGACFAHASPFLKDRVRQVPAYGQTAKATALEKLEWLDRMLADRRFVAGETYTIADITAQVAIDLGAPSVFTVEPELPNLPRWIEDVSAWVQREEEVFSCSPSSRRPGARS